MKLRNLFIYMLVIMLAAGALAACSGGGGEESQEQEPPAGDVLDSNDIIDIVFGDLGISVSQGSEIQVSAPDGDGNLTVTFKVADKDCEYVVNQNTGEIISKDVPDGVVEEAKSSGDPAEEAINAAFDSIDGYNGGAENISVKQSGTDYIVDFDWNGEHYSITYDTNEKKVK